MGYELRRVTFTSFGNRGVAYPKRWTFFCRSCNTHRGRWETKREALEHEAFVRDTGCVCDKYRKEAR